MSKILTEEFFRRDGLEVAPELVGKILARRLDDGSVLRERIAETELYRGAEDKAATPQRAGLRGRSCSTAGAALSMSTSATVCTG